MLYKYMRNDDIEKLHNSDRVAFIIKNVKTVCMSEYLNNFLIVLSNNGVNINIFNIAKVRKVDKHTYDVLMTVRKCVDTCEIAILNNVIKMCDNIQYIK